MHPVQFLLLAVLLVAHPFLELLNLCLQHLVLLKHLIYPLHAVPLAQLLRPLNPKESIVGSSCGLDFSPKHPRVNEVDEGVDLEDDDEATDAT